MAAVTFNKGANTFSTAVTGGIIDPSLGIIDIQAVMERVRNPSTPLVDALGFGEAIDNPQPIVVHKREIDKLSIVNGAIDNAVTTIAVPTGNGVRFTRYDLWVIYNYVGNNPASGQLDPTSKEIIRITATPVADSLTGVERGFGDTSPSAHHNGAYMRKIGSAMTQVSDFAETPRKRGDIQKFFFEELQAKVTTGWAARNTPTYEQMTDPHAADVTEATYQLKKDLDTLGWQGTANSGSGVSPESFAGLDELITYREDAAGDPLTYDMMNQWLLERWEAKGSETVQGKLWMNSGSKTKVNTFLRDIRRATATEGHLSNVVNKLTFDTGTYDIEFAHNVPPGKIYLLTEKFLKFHPYKNGAFRATKLSTQGNYDSTAIWGRYTLIDSQPETHGVLENFSQDPADYAPAP